MKKILSYILLLAMCLSFTACGQDNASDENSEEQTDSNVLQQEEQNAKMEKPCEVPKVLIYTGEEEITTEAYTDCKIVIIDEEGGSYETLRDEASTIKIRGNSTTSGYKKPFNIKFSEKTDVLGMGENKKWSLLANCFDKTLIRNLVVFDVAKQLNVPYTPDYRVVDVYLDNELQGSYLLVDSVEVSSTRVDIDTTENEFLLELDKNPADFDTQYIRSTEYGIRFAINEPEKIDLTDEQLEYVKNFITEAEKALAGGDMEEIEKYFDIESMVSFYLVQEFFRNVDVNTSSTRFHIKDGKIYGGPVWDFDLSSGNYNWGYYRQMFDGMGNSYAGLFATNMPWFEALTQIEEFRELVTQKFLENQALFVNLYEDNELGQNHIDETIATYRESFYRNHEEAGWDVSKVHTDELFLERMPDTTYEENVEYFRKWLRKRNEWLLREWEEFSK